MVLYLHWLAVPLVTILVLAILLWGMRRDPRIPRNTTLESTGGDSGGPAHSISFAPSVEPLSASLVSARRFLTGLWGADTPDLTIAYWSRPDAPAIRLCSYHQDFLPLENNLSGGLAAMETRLFDGAAQQNIPERSRLLTAWTFLHLPSREQDLVVQSFFTGTKLEHCFFLMDADGKLGRIHLDPETSGDLLVGATWYPYRRAVSALLAHDQQAGIFEEFQALTQQQQTKPKAHAWIAHLANQKDNSSSEVRRHVALSLELDAQNYLARLERARLEAGSFPKDSAVALKEHLASQTDDEAQVGHLLAQSLVLLRQSSPARSLCEMLLLEAGTPEVTQRLLRLIHQCERGAQT